MIAVLRAQSLDLDLLLDALGQRDQTQGAAELDQGVDEGGGIGRTAHLRHERAVDLEHVDGELAEVGERRVAGAEVVDGDLHAEILETRQPVDGGVGVLHEHGFGDLDHEGLRGHAVGVEHRPHVVDEPVKLELAHGHVDRHGQLVSLACHRANWAQASLSTQRPTSTICPLSSSAGMNWSGAMVPLVG